jgi:hypothetical protein
MKTLLEKVRAIDKDAANYIESEVLPRWQVETRIKKQVETMSAKGQLEILFIWEDTPQKGAFWRGIYKQLGE